MDPTKMTTQELVIYATLINAGVGFVLGLVPLIIGFLKRNTKYALIGFVGSIVGGAILGVILSVPISAIFTWLIVRKPKASSETSPDIPVDNSKNS